MAKPDIPQIQIPVTSLKVLIPIVCIAYCKKLKFEGCTFPTNEEIKTILDILIYEWAQTHEEENADRKPTHDPIKVN